MPSGVAPVTTAIQSKHLKERFLEAFGETGIIRSACTAVGISRKTVYDWKRGDPDFLVAFQQAEIDSTELLEHEARRRAYEGTVRKRPHFHRGKLVGEEITQEYSDLLMIFLLKARAPEKYRERTDVRMEIRGPEIWLPEEQERLIEGRRELAEAESE